jgi:RHS repeat-associated protein
MKTSLMKIKIFVGLLLIVTTSIYAQTPNPPSNIQGTNVTLTSFTLSWSPVSGVDKYLVDVATTQAFQTGTFIRKDAFVSTTSLQVNNLTAGTTYYYRARSMSADYQPGSYSSTFQTTTICNAPTFISPANVSVSGFTVRWDPTPGATSYRMDVSNDPGFGSYVSGFQNLTVSGTSKVVTVPAGGLYHIRLRAVNLSGTSLNAVTSILAVNIPSTPTASAATDVGSLSFRANWSSVANATHYLLDVSAKSDFSTMVAGYSSLSVTGTNAVVTVPVADTYYYRVRATNTSGSSSYSAVITAFSFDRNYVRTVDVLVKGKTSTAAVDNAGTTEAMVSYTFFDGLGRPIQSVVKRNSPAQNDLVTPIQYDEFGRERKKFLPYTDGTNGWFKENALRDLDESSADPMTRYRSGAQFDFYQDNDVVTEDLYPYSESILEASPLHRLFKQGLPGTDWQPVNDESYTGQDHVIKKAYETNGANEVRLWKYTNPTTAIPLGIVTGTGTAPLYYSPNTLTRNRTKDEHQKEVIEYVDKQGKTVLKRVQAGHGTLAINDMNFASTYYIYDDFGNLVCVIPPEASKQLANTFIPLTWGSLVGVSVEPDNSLKKTTPTAYDGGAYCATALPASTGGWVRMIAEETDKSRMIGFSTSNAGANTTINFALELASNGHVYIWEGGIQKSDLGLYSSGTPVMIAREAGIINYYVGDNVKVPSTLTTSGSPSTSALYVDVALNHLDATIKNVDISFSTEKALLNNFGFRYAYDGRNRMTMKKIPGAEVVSMVYDDRDRLVLTQDGNQRAGATKYWSFTKYDLLDRPIGSGIMESPQTREEIQTAVNAFYNSMSPKIMGERYMGAAAAGNVHGYTNVTYPVNPVTATYPTSVANSYITVNYYDTYDFRSMWGGRNYVNDTLTHKLNGAVQYEQPSTPNPNVLGLLTGTKVKVLDNTTSGGHIWLKTVNYYDDRNRNIQTHSDNLNSGVDRTSTLYDFAGKVLVSKQFHHVFTWTTLVSSTSLFGTLTKIGSGNSWGVAGAVSQSFLGANEDGAYEFVTTEGNTKKAIGLSAADPNTNYVTMQFGFLLNNNNTYDVYESGVPRTTGTNTYAIGDVFRIERRAGVIKYFHNGAELPLTNTPSTTILMVDAGFGTTAGVIPYGSFTAASHPKVITRRFKYDHAGRLTKTFHRIGTGELATWTNITNVTSAQGNLVATASNGGAASVTSIAASADGWMEFRAPQTDKGFVAGLSDTDQNTSFTTIDYGIYCQADGTLSIQESGVNVGSFGAYTTNDIFRVERNGSVIRYKKNQRVIYTSTLTSTSLLMADVSLIETGSSVAQLTLGSGMGAGYVLLSSNEYNELSQLIDKKLHSTGGTAFKQAIDTRYNIRGWLTSINDAALTLDNAEPKDYFGMEFGYANELGSGNSEYDPDLDASVIAHYKLNGNTTDEAPGGINGTLQGSPQPATDAQGNAGQAYSFTTNDYISIPGSQSKYAFVHNTAVFTISVFVKLNNIDSRSMIIGNTVTSPTTGFFLMYENYSGTADHQLRFAIYKPGSQAYNAFGGIRTINDTNWHHVTVVGDGENIRFYVDGLPDGPLQPIPATYLSQGNATYNLTIAKVGTLSLSGSLDEVTILNRPLTPVELQLLLNRAPVAAKIDLRQYNGNISGVKWSNNLGLSDIKMQAYNYSYDAMNRLWTSTHKLQTAPTTWTAGLFNENILAYDLNGNIQHLQRTGQSVAAGVAIDNMVYNYGTGTALGNRLNYVQDNIVNSIDKSKGFVDRNAGTAIDYTYDANGNMITDLNKSVSGITYNYLNLPLTVTRSNAAIYTYDATGRKLAQTVTSKKTFYSGDFIYENEDLQSISHEEGRATFSNETLVFKHGFEEVNTTLAPATGATQTAVTILDQKYVNFNHTDTNSGKGPYDIGGIFTVNPGEKYKVRVKGYRTGQQAWVKMLFGGTVLVQGPTLPSGANAEAWVELTATVPAGSTPTTLSLRITWDAATLNSNFHVNEIELIRMESDAPEYQYNLKDHLGNVRLSFTTKDGIDKYTATFEDNTEAKEREIFDNYSRVTNDLFDHTDALAVYTKAQLLNGGNNSQIGVTKSFAVMPGDEVNVDVYARYLDNTSPGGNIANFSTALLAAFGAATPAIGEVRTASAALENYGNQIEASGSPGSEEDWPQGWLNVLVFDKNFILVDAAIQQVNGDGLYGHPMGSGVKGEHDHLSKQVTIKEPGYVFIYVSNEGAVQQDIYFDDLTIVHTKSPVIQIDDYYPFGLTFNSWRRENSVYNRWKFQGQEHTDDLDLGWDAFKWRNHQPDIGRFFNVDPLSEKYVYNSPFAFSENHVVAHIELEGLEKVTIQKTFMNNMKYKDSYAVQRRTSGGSKFAAKLENQTKINVFYFSFKNDDSGLHGEAKRVGNMDQFNALVKRRPEIYGNLDRKEVAAAMEKNELILIGVNTEAEQHDSKLGISATLNHEEVAHGLNLLNPISTADAVKDHKAYHGRTGLGLFNDTPSIAEIIDNANGEFSGTVALEQLKELLYFILQHEKQRREEEEKKRIQTNGN